MTVNSSKLLLHCLLKHAKGVNYQLRCRSVSRNVLYILDVSNPQLWHLLSMVIHCDTNFSLFDYYFVRSEHMQV